MIADCPDCGRVELYRGRCPVCGGESWGVPGGIPARSAKKLPFLQLIKAVKKPAAVQRSIAAFSRFRRRG